MADMSPPRVPDSDYFDQLQELIREIIVRARAGMITAPAPGPGTPESADAIVEEFAAIIDIVVNGP